MIEILSFLDLRTIATTMVFTTFFCTLVMILLWRQNYKRLDGIRFWVADFVLQTLTVFLIALRGQIPDLISIDFANTLSLIGIYLGYRGLQAFFHIKTKQWFNYTILLVFPALFTWFTFVIPDLAVRNLVRSIFTIYFFILYVQTYFFRGKKGLFQQNLLIGLVFVGYLCVEISRVFDFFMVEHFNNDFFKAGTYEAYVLLSYTLLSILLTLSLAFLFNRSLLDNLAIQEEKFSKAFHTSPYAIVLARLNDGSILDVNETFLQYSGYESSEITGKTLMMLNLWENMEDRTYVLNELGTKKEVRDKEFYFRQKNGKRMIGLFSAQVLTINDEKYVLSSINDISKRKQAEEELKASEAKFRTLFTRMSEGFALHEIVYDAQHKPIDYVIKDINPAFEKQVGINAINVKEKLASVAYNIPVAPYLDIYSKVAETGEPQSFNTYFEPLDKYFDVLAFSPYHGSFATVFSDITEQRRAESILIENEARLKNLNATKDKFFSIIAHDLKGPFNSILGFSSLLSESVLAKDYENAEMYATIIHESTQSTLILLMNLLEWSRAQTGRMEYSPENLEINLLTKDIVALLEHAAHQKSIDISIDGIPNSIVYADRMLLSTILRNLISNAIKFTNPGGEVNLSATHQNEQLKFCVRDNGIGMQQEKLDKLFRMEENVSSPGTQNEMGTGLGLLLCKEFVEKQGGKIWAESVIDQGSSFYFTISTNAIS